LGEGETNSENFEEKMKDHQKKEAKLWKKTQYSEGKTN
jgi:hypothetical protein